MTAGYDEFADDRMSVMQVTPSRYPTAAAHGGVLCVIALPFRAAQPDAES